MKIRWLSASALAVSVVLGASAPAQTVSYDVVDGLYANRPIGGTGGPETQLGADHWWYKYDPTVRFGQQGSLIVRDPNTFLLMELGRDGTTGPYGWAANVGPSINNRPVFRNGDVAARGQKSGTTQGDGVWGNAENGAQLALEWKAPADGTADVSYGLVGRNDVETDIEWHLATWVGNVWTDLGFVLVTQAHTPASPASLAATGLGLSAGDSIYLYGQIADHDAYDGTVFYGGIEFTPTPAEFVPEPGAAVLALLAVLGLTALLRRRMTRS
jgi:hypothetical protein